jgi:hypothetical protein
MRKIKPIICLFLAVVFLAGCNEKESEFIERERRNRDERVIADEADISEAIVPSAVDGQRGNSPSNIINGGTIAELDGWIYYRDGQSGHLFNIHHNGGGRAEIVGDSVWYINIIGDWIYYVNASDGNRIYKIRHDGTERTRLSDNGGAYLNVIGSVIYYAGYYNSDGGIFKMNTDGSGFVQISDDKAFNLNVIDDWIYYTAETEETYTFIWDSSWTDIEDEVLHVTNIFKMRTDGTERTLLSEDNVRRAIAHDGWIYYDISYFTIFTAENDHRLYRIRTDGTDKEVVHSYSGCFNLYDDWIFLYDLSFNVHTLGLYKMRLDGREHEFLFEADGSLRSVHVFEEWVYATDSSWLSHDDRLYKMRHDGSQLQRLDEYISPDLDSVEFGRYFEDYYTLDRSVMGNTLGNMANDSTFVESGGWVYYEAGARDIFRVRYDSLETEEVPALAGAFHLNIVGDRVYFKHNFDGNTLHKINLDGTDLTKLDDIRVGFELHVINDWIYYTDWEDGDLSLVRIRTDGTNKEIVTDDKVYSAIIAGDWVFYSNAYDSFSMYRIRTDGTGKTKLLEGDVRPFSADREWIYFIDVNSGWDRTGLYRIRHDGSDRTFISSGGGANKHGDWIYFTDNGLYKIRTDGTEKTRLGDDRSVRDICIIGDWVYYNRAHSGSWYNDIVRIRTDGTDRQEIISREN